MTLVDMQEKLKKDLTPKRFEHSLGVMNTAIELAHIYGVDEEKAKLAGLLHDCARHLKGKDALRLCERYHIPVDSISSQRPELLHGPIGSKLVETEYGIRDDEIQRAIYYHTTGCVNMSMLDKIIFIADYIEPGRNFKGVDEVRKEAYVNIDRAIILALDNTIKLIISRGGLIHIDTINARNDIVVDYSSVSARYYEYEN